MKCPRCGVGSNVLKYNKCGDVRCDSTASSSNGSAVVMRGGPLEKVASVAPSGVRVKCAVKAGTSICK